MTNRTVPHNEAIMAATRIFRYDISYFILVIAYYLYVNGMTLFSVNVNSAVVSWSLYKNVASVNNANHVR